jgi:hypothetical protein
MLERWGACGVVCCWVVHDVLEASAVELVGALLQQCCCFIRSCLAHAAACLLHCMAWCAHALSMLRLWQDDLFAVCVYLCSGVVMRCAGSTAAASLLDLCWHLGACELLFLTAGKGVLLWTGIA